jgi:hypothetical protein
MMPKFWVSKYAMTKGIFPVNGEVSEISRSVLVVKDTWTYYLHGEGKEWHRTPEAAVARAEEMRTAKIASLKKQIAKVEKMTFAGAE